jgi:site-specific DNA-methyltransferase (adenine-specific)
MNHLRNTLIHGDCTRFLPTLPSASIGFILTDPPYLVNYRPRDGRSVAGDTNAAWLKPAFIEMYRVLQADGYCFTFYGWPHADRFMQAFRAAGFRPVGHFSFPKRYSSSVGHVRCQHECGYLLAKGNPGKPSNPLGDVIDWKHYTGNRLHPTEKPVSVLMPLIETYSNEQGTVLDPFAGSGSTLLAAKMLNRKWLGVELDRKYHAAAAKRLAIAHTRPAHSVLNASQVESGFHASQPASSLSRRSDR